MINANELRVGNWVTEFTIDTPYPKGKPVRITYIYEDDDFANCEPIHLTPGILEKCGFSINRSDELCIEILDISTHLEMVSRNDNYYYPSFTQTPQGGEERTVYFNRINSVHQLQNLFYALTQTELPITL